MQNSKYNEILNWKSIKTNPDEKEVIEVKLYFCVRIISYFN